MEELLNEIVSQAELQVQNNLKNLFWLKFMWNGKNDSFSIKKKFSGIKWTIQNFDII